MTQHHTKAGSPSKVTGQQRVSPGCEARDATDAPCTNAPHGKRILTPFFRQLLIGLILSFFCTPPSAYASNLQVVKLLGRVYGVESTHQSRSDSPFGSFTYVNSLRPVAGTPGCLSQGSCEEIDSGGQKPLASRVPIILIHGFSPTDHWPLDWHWENFIKSFYEDPRDLKSLFKIYTMRWHSNDLSVLELGAELRDFLDTLDDDDDAGFRGKRIILVGHSTGGLIARSYMQDHWARSMHPYGGISEPGGERVLRLVTLGTPHHGSPAANKFFRDDYIFTHASVAWFEVVKLVDERQLAYDLPTRSDLHWDDFDGLFPYTFPPNGSYERDRNEWLQKLNCVWPFNRDNHNCTTTEYSSKIVAYGGVYPGAATSSLAITLSTCYFYPPGDDFQYCLSQSLLENVFRMAGDGIVPYDSAVYARNLSGRVKARTKVGYDHSDMVQGYTRNASDPLFGEVKEDVLAALPAAPVAQLTMTYGSKSGVEGSPLNVTVPKGSTATVAFSSAGSSASGGPITAYEWRIDVTTRSTASSFSYPLGVGTHEVQLKITDSFGRTDRAVGYVVIQEESPPTTLPSATTNQASQVTDAYTILNGQVTPNSTSATVWFQWGTTTSYGQSSSLETLDTNVSTPYARAISGLAPSTMYHFRIVAQNQAGVKYGQDQTFTTSASVDSTAPSITITAPTSGPTYSTTFSGVALAGRASDNRAVSVVSWVNDRGGSRTASGTTDWTVPSVSLSPGANVITVTAWDTSGNSQSAILTVTYNIQDNVSPDTEILSGPSGTWPSSSFTFTWTGSDNVTPTGSLLYTTYLDGYDLSSTTYSSATSRSFSSVPNGTYTFWVRAMDAAGNIDYTAPVRTFTVNEPDLIPPTVITLFLAGGGSNNDLFKTGRSYPIVFEATDNIRPVQADLFYSTTGGAPWTPIVTGISVRPGQNILDWRIQAGTVTSNGALRVVVRDAAGNAGERTFAPFTILDGTPPTVRVLTPNGGDIWPLGSTQTIRWTASGVYPINGVKIYLLGNNTVYFLAGLPGSATSYSWTLPITPATNEALIHVVVEDTKGNQNDDFSDNFFTMSNPDAPPPAPWHVPALVTTLPPPPHPSAAQSIRGPTLAIDQLGRLHLAAVYDETDWRDGVGVKLYMQHQVIYRTRQAGIWSPQTQITNYPVDIDDGSDGTFGNNTHIVEEVKIAVDQNGHPHIIWIRGNNLPFPNFDDDLFYTFFDGTSWSPPENLSAAVTTNTSSSTRNPAITIDAHNNVHVIWYESDFAGPDSATYHKVKRSGVWQSANRISIPATSWPEMVADAAGNVHLITTCDCSAVYHSRFDGTQWSSTPIVDNLPNYNQYTHIAIGSDDHLHATWRNLVYSVSTGYTDTLYYSSFDGQNWSSVETIQGGFPDDTVDTGSAITVDGLYPIVFWIQRAPIGIYFVQASKRMAAGWSPPVRLSDRTTLVGSRTPVAAASGGAEIHVAWAGFGGIIWNYVAATTLTVTKSGTGHGKVMANPTGINCGTTCQASFSSDTEVTLMAVPEANSTFTGWGGDADCADGQIIMDADKTCTATFSLQPPQLFNLFVSITGNGTVTSDPVGIACPPTCSVDFPTGQSVTLTASPAVGSTFTGWGGEGCSGIGTCTVSMTQARSVTATFTQPFDYTLANSGNITVTQGASGSNTITTTLTSGSTQAVSFSASGLPSGATPTFAPTSCSPTCSSTLTIATSASTPTGTFTITVTGSPLSKTTTFNLVVNPPPFDYTLTNSGNITVMPGAAGSTTITATLSAGTAQAVALAASGLPAGATPTFAPASCTPSCSSTLTMATSATTPTGTFLITVTGTPLSRTTTFNLIVTKQGTTTTVASSVNPATVGQAVTFTATVNVVAPGSGTPTGTVTFLDGTTSLGTATLNAARQATLTTSALSVGAHSITAQYTGDTNFTGSTSAALSQTITRASTVNCTPITSLPIVITVQGLYCFTDHLSTAITSGAAIEIATNNVVLDLNGFKLGGLAAGPGTIATGIYADNRQNIIIKNGTIRGFFQGIVFKHTGGSQGHVVEDIRADQNTYIGLFVGGSGNIVRNNQIVQTGGSTTFGAHADAIGIYVTGPGPRVINNHVINSVKQGTGTAYGILVGSTATGAFIVKNRITEADMGIFFAGGTGKYRNNLTFDVTTPYTGGTDAGHNN